ncbi:MAG: STAS domain-containing protein [Ruminococcus sp.]|uniref:STAS domain-containing protein n=1 Tax=Ruminococcus sp. TaxID=41978 RepID=UPI0039934024
MAVTLETEQETLIAVLNGEIDHHCAKGMRSAIDEKIESCQPDVLILDFGGVLRTVPELV